MPSSATIRNRLEKQGTGENSGTWGTELNAALDRIDESLDGVEAFTLSGSKTLTAINYDDDEARERILKITGGTGGTITIPAVEKWCWVANGSTGDVVLTTGSGASATVKSGNVMAVYSDGTDCSLCLSADFGSIVPKSSGTPTVSSHLVNKAYADGLAFAGALPAQAGNPGKFITTNGASASWVSIALADISNMSVDARAFNAAANFSAMRTTLGLTAAATYSIASQAEAEAGTDPDALMTAERTAQAIAALGPGLGWAQIQQFTGSASAHSFLNIGSYNDFALVIEGLQHGSGSNQTLRIELSTNNGSSYGSAMAIGPSIASSGSWNGVLLLTRTPLGALVQGYLGSTSGQAVTTSPTGAYYLGDINAIRISPSGGVLQVGGSTTLFGR